MNVHQILAAFTPTPEQITNWQLVSRLLLGIAAVLCAGSWITNWMAARYNAAWWRRAQQPPAVDFTERRRLQALKAISEDGR